MRLFCHGSIIWLFLCFTSLNAQNSSLPQGWGVPILLYHGITEEYDPSEVYTISKNQLRQHLGAIKLAGFETIGIQDLYDYFYNNKPLPKKCFMITFDDGRKDSYYNCDPLLKEFGFRAVLFVTTLMQEKEYPLYLSWAELQEVFDTGRWDIQAHGYKFHNLISVNEEGKKGNFGSNLKWLEKQGRLETLEEFKARLLTDLVKQKKDIETHVEGVEVIGFAYPFGDWGGGGENMDSSLAIAASYQMVDKVFPLSFGNVEFDLKSYKVTTTPHLIIRFMDNGSVSPQQIVDLLESLAL